MKVRRSSGGTMAGIGSFAAWTAPGLITFISLGILSHVQASNSVGPGISPLAHPSVFALAARTEPSPVPSPPPVVFYRVVPTVLATAPPTVLDTYQMQLINNARTANGLPQLAWSSCLGGVAASNASRVAAQGQLSHADGANQDLACGLGSSVTGENLASVWGTPSDQSALNLLMASPPHRANILGANYLYVGTAWAVGSNGFACLAEEFG